MKRIILIVIFFLIITSCNQGNKHTDDFNSLQRKELPSILENEENDSIMVDEDLIDTKIDSNSI